MTSTSAPQKVLITHVPALRTKYGRDGWERVRSSIRELVEADAGRGVRTRLVNLADPALARRLGVARVVRHDDWRRVSDFVDAIEAAWAPDYYLLLGATDVVPMQPLDNPLYDRHADSDSDRVVPSDLPYACETPWTTDPGHFRGATRVVGRLPDLLGAREPGALVSRLSVAAGYTQRARSTYGKVFGLTSKDWRDSTELSLARLLERPGGELVVSPRAGPTYAFAVTRRLTHLVNCHGIRADAHFYGVGTKNVTVSLDSATVRIAPGTVAAVECCYGGLLFAPAEGSSALSLPDTYLNAGAYGYLGSTTIAYGSAHGNDQADLLCRFFLAAVLSGASLGRALLQARQEYVFTKSSLGPVDLKTLAQFVLLGDPSIQPVRREAPDSAEPDADPAGRRTARRRRLRANGRSLQRTTTRTEAVPTARSARRTADLVTALGRPLEETGRVRTYRVVAAPDAPAGPRERYHVMTRPGRTGPSLLVAREEAGRLQAVSQLVAKESPPDP